jgi:hypothetical protein
MTFKKALHTVCDSVIPILVVPKWAMGFTRRLRNVRLAFEEFEVCILLSLKISGPGSSEIS